MEPTSSKPSNDSFAHELAQLRDEWWWFLALGVALIIMGVIAISVPFAVTLAAATLFGVLLLLGGVAQLVSCFWQGRWTGTLLHMFTGILYLVVGVLVLKQPLQGAVALTLLLAAFFMVSGIFRIVVSLQYRFHNWGWPLLSGIVSLMLGIIIFSSMPEGIVWVIGLFIGLEMIFNGWVWVMLAFNVRSIPSSK